MELGCLARSLRPSVEHLVSLRHHHPTTSQPHGQLLHRHFYSTSLDPLDDGRFTPPPLRRSLRRQRQSARLLNGSSLPLSHLLHSSSHHHLRRPRREVPCLLPRSRSPCYVLQETLLELNSRAFHCYPLCGMRGSSLDLNSRVLSSVSLLPRNHPPEKTLDLNSRRVFFGIHCTGLVFDKTVDLNNRSFSSVSNDDSESDANVNCEYGGECNDDDENRREDVRVKSGADPEEVAKVCKIIEELFALNHDMEAALDGCEVNPSHDLVVDVLERFRHAPKPAFLFFNWAKQKPAFSHGPRTYNKMMTILGKKRQLETMVALLQEMGEKGLLTMEAFTIAIKAFAAAKEPDEALGIFQLMKRYNFRVGVEIINCLLDTLGRVRLAVEAQALFEKLKDRFTPDMRTYSALLHGWCSAKNLMELYKTWHEMIDKGFKPDVATHNTMLQGLLDCRRRSDAIELLEVMKAKGPSPNVRSYTILMKDFCKERKMGTAIKYFDEIIDYGCQPDAAIYTCLITGFGKVNRMDKVHALLKEMKEKGCLPDGRTYNALMKLMTKRDMPDDAVRIYKKMIESGIRPTTLTYNMIMNSYFGTRNYEMACAVWEEMLWKGCCPDDNSYIVLIGGLIRLGHSEEACKRLEEMIEKGIRTPERNYRRLAADLSSIGNPEILEELARKMKLSGKFEVSDRFARWAGMMKGREFVRPGRRFD